MPIYYKWRCITATHEGTFKDLADKLNFTPAEEYKKMGLSPTSLSNALESAGTVTSALVPWNTCGAYIRSTLGLTAWGAGGYGVFAVFNWLMPLMNIALAFLGLTVADMNNVRLAKKRKKA